LAFDFVRSPAFLVTAGLLDRAQLPKEENAIVRRVDRKLRLAADDKPELAGLEVNASRAWLRLPAASTARRGDHHRLAGRTFTKLRRLATLTLLLRGSDRTSIDGERPFDAILGEAVAVHGAAMVENHCIGLALIRPQHSADHLAVKSHLLVGPRQNAATHGGHVPALGQHHAVGDDLGLAGCEPRQDRLTLSDRCDSVQVLGANTGLYELVADMDRVLDTDSEADRSPALAVLQPVLDHVPDQVVGVHATLKLTDNVVALLSSNATEIGIDRRIDSRPHQEAAHDQVRDLRALDHRVEDVAETATVTSTRCCGHAEQRRVGIER